MSAIINTPAELRARKSDFRVTHAGPSSPNATHNYLSYREREATLESFRYHLRERECELLTLGLRADHRGPRAWVGIAGDAERCPVAAWLRLDRAYGKVIVHAGDMGTWPYGRYATFSAYGLGPRHSVGRALGLGRCDLALTAAIAWLDGVFEVGRIVSVAECLHALDELAQTWPETVARLTPTLEPREPLEPRGAPIVRKARKALATVGV